MSTGTDEVHKPALQEIAMSWMKSRKKEQVPVQEEKPISKLVVGQRARMKNGGHLEEVVVREITDTYVQVEPLLLGQNQRPWMARFNKNGAMPSPFWGGRTDVSKLAVGQRVLMESGIYSSEGTVATVTPYGVTVQILSELMEFNHEGRNCNGAYDTRECGPWFLTRVSEE